MRRTPFAGNANGVWDNLVAATEGKFVRDGDHADAFIFGIGPDPQALLERRGLRRYLMQELSGRGVPPHELAYFVERVLVFVTSCDERRFGQWEKVSWWDFVGAGSRSEEYQKVLAAGLTRNLVAAKETVASTRTIGNMGEAFVFNIAQQGNDGELDRVLDLPTNEAWIDPWVAHLRGLGVRFVEWPGARGVRDGPGPDPRRAAGRRRGSSYPVHGRLVRQRDAGGAGAQVLEPARAGARPAPRGDGRPLHRLDGRHPVLPARAGRDHQRAHHLRRLPVGADGAHPGSVLGATGTSTRDYGNGEVVDCLSVDISNWDAPGVLYGKPAKQCTPAGDRARRSWRRSGCTRPRRPSFPTTWCTRGSSTPACSGTRAAGRNTNATPLLVNTVGTWEKRPTSRTAIPNLFLAGDYVQTNIDLATMEGANESAPYGGQRPARRSGSTRRAGGDLQALPRTGPRGRQANRRRALRRGSAQRPRRARRLTDTGGRESPRPF